MSRLIDADKLVEELEAFSMHITGSHHHNFIVSQCKNSIKRMVDEQPTVNVPDRNVGEWIPCSERLPDKEKIVLVSQTYSWQHFEDGASVTIGRLHQREENTIPYWEFQYYRPDFKHGTIMDNGIICPGSEYVSAWMPLPEPYNQGGEKSCQD